jgi:hypothetical protein
VRSEEKSYGVRKIAECMPDGCPQAVSCLEIDQGVKDACNEGEDDHHFISNGFFHFFLTLLNLPLFSLSIFSVAY